MIGEGGRRASCNMLTSFAGGRRLLWGNNGKKLEGNRGEEKVSDLSTL